MTVQTDPDRWVPLISDISYGVLLLVGIIWVWVVSNPFSFPGGLLVGVIAGYSVHVAVHMAQFSVNIEDESLETEVE